MPSSGKTTYLKASKLGEVLAKKVECVIKATEKQNRAGELRSHKRRTCSVLPLLRSSQNYNANYIHRHVAFANVGGKGMRTEKEEIIQCSWHLGLVKLF